MKKLNIIIYLFAIALLISSCDDFLSERPSKSSDIVPSTIADMESILAGMFRGDNITPHLIFGTGEVTLSAELEKRLPGSYTVDIVQAATWERVHSGTNKDYMWMYRYQNIFRSNLVFSCLPKIDASESEINEIKAKAAFRRAMSYMELLDVYTLPYCEKNLEEPGLVLTDKTGFDYSLKRSSLKDTYDFIEKDILLALTVKASLTNPMGANSPYRVTIAAANALASRFYLMKHDYANAKKYAAEALKLYGVDKLVDYTAIGYSDRVDQGSITIDGQTIDFEVKYPTTNFNFNPFSWTEDYFTGTSVGSSFSYGFSTDNLPSEEHIATFDEDGGKEYDARWKYFYLKNYTYLYNKPVDIPYYMKPASIYTLSVPEMILNMAECEARAGDWETGLEWANKLRAKRIEASGQVNLTASSKDEAIAKIIRERRRENGPIKRLYDIRRYNSNDYAADDVTLTTKFYSYTVAGVDQSSAIKTYTLAPDAREWAFMIPEGDVLAGKGELLQNTY